MQSDIKPGKILGNLYFVGNVAASCHLIDTGEGLILIDTGYQKNVEWIIESIEMLGFNPKDIKYIIHSHGHGDHTRATEGLLKYCNAETFLNFKDIRYIEGFTPDHDLKEGDVIELGNTKISVLETPGHTLGTVSFFFDLTENGKTYKAAMFGGAGLKQIGIEFLKERGLPLSQRDDFVKTCDRIMDIPVDVFVGNHVGQNNTKVKLEALQSGKCEGNPFIDPTEWKRFIADRKASALKMIEDNV